MTDHNQLWLIMADYEDDEAQADAVIMTHDTNFAQVWPIDAYHANHSHFTANYFSQGRNVNNNFHHIVWYGAIFPFSKR